jgi:hypothetical protein
MFIPMTHRDNESVDAPIRHVDASVAVNHLHARPVNALGYGFSVTLLNAFVVLECK